MSIISQRITKIELGPAQYHQNLTMFPLVETEPRDADFLLLDEALEAGLARVTEISEGGSVPELKFINQAARPILLLDGEELIGAKQNRIVNLTILVPAQTTIVIPVSCVEQGRWHSQSAAFKAAKRTHFASGRSRKANRVTESLQNSGSRRGNQGEVWEDIETKFRRFDVNSPTAAAATIYEARGNELENYRQAFSPITNQTGVLFAINGKALGLDLFDSPKPLQSLLPGLIESYALDALDQREENSPAQPAPAATATKLLSNCAAAEISVFPAIGLGDDLRLQSAKVTGGALALGERVVHLCAFRPPQQETSNHPRRGSRITRASARRRQYQIPDENEFFD